jgi:glutamyl/glutaminyl-tRNA synthetase
VTQAVPSAHELYRGRLAPSPTGLLHLGHARTFGVAAQRAAQHHGILILRNEDLDTQRCRQEFVQAMYEDLRWLGVRWTEGPDRGGPYGPYSQSERRLYYLETWRTLRDRGLIFPCTCSRKDLTQAAAAPHESDDEPIYPGCCRSSTDAAAYAEPAGVNWRFRVPDDEDIAFDDLGMGRQSFTAGQQFGDFLVWRRDDTPAYQLAVVVDDAAMKVSEVVRGADLLRSTARQLLLYRALRLAPPDFYHCPLVRDQDGMRLAKRHDALSIRHLRKSGWSPQQVLGSADARLQK